MGFWDIFFIIFLVVGVIIVALYFINKWAFKKVGQQQEMIDRTKQTATIYIIDKKRDKITNANFPKAVIEQMPKYSKLMKMNLVKAKIGPQITTLMCEKRVFNALPIKKNVKVEIAGMYITDMKGMKTEEEMKVAKKAKKEKLKKEKKENKDK